MRCAVPIGSWTTGQAPLCLWYQCLQMRDCLLLLLLGIDIIFAHISSIRSDGRWIFGIYLSTVFYLGVTVRRCARA